MSDGRTHQAEIRCECGEWVEIPVDAKKAECTCGAIYAATVSRLAPPGT